MKYMFYCKVKTCISYNLLFLLKLFSLSIVKKILINKEIPLIMNNKIKEYKVDKKHREHMQ